MSVISQLPTWAQGPVQKFKEQVPMEGTQTRPMDQDSFDESANFAAGVILWTSKDEVPGEDQALQQPGVIVRNGVKVHYEGDVSDARGKTEVVVVGKRKGIEYATYVESRPNGFSSLQMAYEDGSIELNGSHAKIKGGNLEGYLISGSSV
jgi:hypothetical protein